MSIREKWDSFGGKEVADVGKQARTQCNYGPPSAMGIAEGGVQLKNQVTLIL
jgi:hypothetical protein